MGKATTRITAQDFVTPPELAGLPLALNGAGRIGGVRLRMHTAGPQTYLADCYQQVPLRVLSLGFGPNEPALVYLLNPTAGLFDGDAQLVELCAGPFSRTFVTGQSATRIHPCLAGFSTQQWHVRVEAGAKLVVLPGPAIPFHGCRYFQRVVVDLADGADLIWGDIWLAGRYARGTESERFQFRTVVQGLTVRRNGRLLFRDRFCWQGPWDAATAAWHFGQADAYGSLFSTIAAPPMADTPVEENHQENFPEKAVSFETAEHHTCWRWLGPSENVITAVTTRAMTLAAQGEGGAESWLLASHQLAPNHWFSNQRVPGGLVGSVRPSS